MSVREALFAFDVKGAPSGLCYGFMVMSQFS
jgi:hypothetical protein